MKSGFQFAKGIDIGIWAQLMRTIPQAKIVLIVLNSQR